MDALRSEKQLPSSRLFSIGHSNHTWDKFVAILRAADVAAVADVRSSPYSKWTPHFNRPELQRGLRDSGIEYLFLGEQLGGRPANADVYDDSGRVNYELTRTTVEFKSGISRLIQEAQRSCVAMLCAEEDPLDCHRGLMITPALVELGRSPLHLRGDGSVETTAELEERLFAETGVGDGILDGLFAASVTPEERQALLQEAHRTLARKRGFRRAEASDI